MRGFLLGILVCLVAFPAIAFVYLKLGYAPVATAAPALPFEKQMAHLALNARVDKEAPKTAPFVATEANLISGAHIYQEDCAVCHGLSGQPKTAIAKGMYPPVPQLFKGKGVSDDPAGETYWKVANGIRLTGMPAFKDSLTEQQMWEVSMLVAQSDKLPPSVQALVEAPLKSQ